MHIVCRCMYISCQIRNVRRRRLCTQRTSGSSVLQWHFLKLSLENLTRTQSFLKYFNRMSIECSFLFWRWKQITKRRRSGQPLCNVALRSFPCWLAPQFSLLVFREASCFAIAFQFPQFVLLYSFQSGIIYSKFLFRYVSQCPSCAVVLSLQQNLHVWSLWVEFFQV